MSLRRRNENVRQLPLPLPPQPLCDDFKTSTTTLRPQEDSCTPILGVCSNISDSITKENLADSMRQCNEVTNSQLPRPLIISDDFKMSTDALSQPQEQANKLFNTIVSPVNGNCTDGDNHYVSSIGSSFDSECFILASPRGLCSVEPRRAHASPRHRSLLSRLPKASNNAALHLDTVREGSSAVLSRYPSPEDLVFHPSKEECFIPLEGRAFTPTSFSSPSFFANTAQSFLTTPTKQEHSCISGVSTSTFDTSFSHHPHEIIRIPKEVLLPMELHNALSLNIRKRKASPMLPFKEAPLPPQF